MKSNSEKQQNAKVYQETSSILQDSTRVKWQGAQCGTAEVRAVVVLPTGSDLEAAPGMGGAGVWTGSHGAGGAGRTGSRAGLGGRRREPLRGGGGAALRELLRAGGGAGVQGSRGGRAGRCTGPLRRRAGGRQGAQICGTGAFDRGGRGRALPERHQPRTGSPRALHQALTATCFPAARPSGATRANGLRSLCLERQQQPVPLPSQSCSLGSVRQL